MNNKTEHDIAPKLTTIFAENNLRMPPELAFEIFSYLTVRDIVNLMLSHKNAYTTLTIIFDFLSPVLCERILPMRPFATQAERDEIAKIHAREQEIINNIKNKFQQLDVSATEEEAYKIENELFRTYNLETLHFHRHVKNFDPDFENKYLQFGPLVFGFWQLNLWEHIVTQGSFVILCYILPKIAPYNHFTEYVRQYGYSGLVRRQDESLSFASSFISRTCNGSTIDSRIYR